jgi:hypothetical protein
MANFQEEYMKWLLDGANPKTMPPSAFPVPGGAPGAPPVDMPPIPYQAKQVPPAGMPPIPPEAYGPQPGVTRGISPWEMLKSVPFAAGEMAPAVAKYAGGAAAAHLAFPPEAGTSDEDKIAQILFANPPTQSVKPSLMDEIKMVTSRDLPQSSLEPAAKPAAPPAGATVVKQPAAKAPMKDENSPDARLQKRIQEREDEKAKGPQSREPGPGSLMDLRIKARENIRQNLKGRGNY